MSGVGLVVSAKQTYYPIELSNSELLVHYDMIQEYHQDISANVIAMSNKFKPDTKLISQQPEMEPLSTRREIVSFLFQLSVVTRVTDGIFFHAVRLYDRYCSKRVVLQDQAKFVVATCLWVAAKTWGGCNHIINDVAVPTGGRFYGPNKRARIPRLHELVHYCGGPKIFDEPMFVQMERHILATLNWNICEPMINDYVLNVDENCLIQYELYKRQLTYNNQLSQDSESTIDEYTESDRELLDKIKLINLKNFLIDLSVWQYDLLKYEMFEISHGIFTIINKFMAQDHGPLLVTPTVSPSCQSELLEIFITAVVEAPQLVLEVYENHDGVSEFLHKVREYHDEQTAVASTKHYFNTNAAAFDQTPMRNTSTNSESSLFSSAIPIGEYSPLTPHMHGANVFKADSNCGSTASLTSISNTYKRGYDDDDDDDADKENIDPMLQPRLPKPKFANTGIYPSPNSNLQSNSSSLISLANQP